MYSFSSLVNKKEWSQDNKDLRNVKNVSRMLCNISELELRVNKNEKLKNKKKINKKLKLTRERRIIV